MNHPDTVKLAATPPHQTVPDQELGLVWLRRDLRLNDHSALAQAQRECRQVQGCFVFDRAILDSLPSEDRRVEFIHKALLDLESQLQTIGAGLCWGHGQADLVVALAQALGARRVYTTHDDEPAALARDERIEAALAAIGARLIRVCDTTILPTRQVLTQQAQPYRVYTPYQRAWMASIRTHDLAERRVSLSSARWLGHAPRQLALQKLQAYQTDTSSHGRWLLQAPSLTELGFEATNLTALGIVASADGASSALAQFSTRMGRYRDQRDYPAVKGVSYLSVHLRFGTISARACVRAAMAHVAAPDPGDHPTANARWQQALASNPGAQTWVNELIWREFFMQVLTHFPHAVERAFKPEYDAIQWHSGEQAERWFEAWCQGRTGYPIVDAAQRQLLQTGWMHNRLRMISASFLIKHLGIAWQRGEAWFARHLNDFDLAANNGGWQWAASSGCDAQPYFRIFNPILQSEKFDPEARFIRRYIPELTHCPPAAIHDPKRRAALPERYAYPSPVVEHTVARHTTLMRYACVKGKE